MTSNNSIAENILKQLGGNRFIAMTGSREFVRGERYLKFKLPRGVKNKAQYVKIFLELNDTYTLTFFSMSRSTFEVKTISVNEMIYNVSLREVFTQETGLYVAL